MPPSILIVEDDPFLLRLLVTKLGEVPGYSVVVAANGEVALEQARAIRPALILLDIMLPKKSGFEVLQELRQDPQTASIPVIIISNLGSPEDIQQATELGVIAYFVKANLTVSELVEKIRERLMALSLTGTTVPASGA